VENLKLFDVFDHFYLKKIIKQFEKHKYSIKNIQFCYKTIGIKINTGTRLLVKCLRTDINTKITSL